MDKRNGEKIEQGVPGALPAVESPPLSPAGASSEASRDADACGETGAAASNEAPFFSAAPPRPWIRLSRRHQHRLTLAIWVALLAGLGAVFGGAISNGLAGHGRTDVASVEQRQAMQQSIDHLAKQVSELKVKLAAAVAATHSQIAKISARADSASSSDVTGSIPVARVAPVPLPRPAPRIAAVDSRPPVLNTVVHAWRILRARDGLIDVEGRDGIYEVVPGAVLPGLGPVQSIERRNGRWVVVTPKGLIVSARDRGYFKDF